MSGLDARAAAIAALQADLAAEEPEDDAVAAAAAASPRARARRLRAARALPGHRSPRGFGFRLREVLLGVLCRRTWHACLVCGKYFQGRGPSTHAYTHALEASHHVFLRLDDGRAYCLPDGYEIEDAKPLDDVRAALARAFHARGGRDARASRSSGAGGLTAPSISPARSA